MTFIKRMFTPDYNKYNGIRPINIYAMRFIFLLMSTLLAFDVWSHIVTNQHPWQPSDAMDWSVWAAFSAFAFIGLFRTVEMIPILLLEILYKGIWLILVALPLYQSGTLTDDATDGMLIPFCFVVLPIVAVPWGYVVKTYLTPKRRLKGIE